MTPDELRNAYEQGYISEQDYLSRLDAINQQNKAVNNWLVQLIKKALGGLSNEQEQVDAVVWLANAREILADENNSAFTKINLLYQQVDLKKSIGTVAASVGNAVKNYATSDLPLAVKVTLPVTLAAAAFIGGESMGVAVFGGAIGLPILLVVFVGVAGITAILESVVNLSDSDKSYVAVIIALIARDEVLRQCNSELKAAMQQQITAPKQHKVSAEKEKLKQQLLAMNPYDFERHVMSFFQKQGMLAWVTQKSNDAGVDGFARHSDGLIVVQCKRNSETNPVGSPVVQQFKGVIEENNAYKGYMVTTSYYTKAAIDSANKSEKLILVDINELINWHKGEYR